MTVSREVFLGRVREALRKGTAPIAPALETRGTVGYQGAGPNPGDHFCEQFTVAGGLAYQVADIASAIQHVLRIVQEKNARRVLLGNGNFLDTLGFRSRLEKLSIDVSLADILSEEKGRETFFKADLSITGVNYLVAETGSMAFLASPREPRFMSLLPPVHVVVASYCQLVPDLFDLFEIFQVGPSASGGERLLPSCLSLVTGPSKTGDIELRLVTGVHGPGEVHLILVTT